MLFIFAILALFALAESMVNLYITKAEMNRTLGIVAEMNYLEHGMVNNYSTKFPYRVDANIHQVMFSWFTEVTDEPIHYALRAVATDVNVLPVIRIQPNGVMPTRPETFVVEYRCAGSRAGQFAVFLHVNISWPSLDNPTFLTLKQEKICTSRDGRRLGGSLDDYDQHGHKLDHGRISLLSGDQLFYVVIGAVSAVIFVVATLLYVYYRANRKLAPSRSSDVSPSDTRRHFRDFKDCPQRQPFLLPFASYGPPAEVPKPPSLASGYLAGKRGSIIHERASNTVDINQALVELTADRNLFQLMPIVELEGTFGEVKWAIWCQNSALASGDIDDEEDQASVDEPLLVKTLKANADRRHFEKFLSEALVFHHMPPHPNLAQICAAATFGSFARPETVTDFPLICYRHSGFGNLKKFLLRCRGIGVVEEGTTKLSKSASMSGSVQTLRTHELVSMGKQLLRAIMHLHKYGIIHKDIAARNCIVSELPGRVGNDRLTVQLCDNALSRDLFPGDYHCLGDNDNRPIKWMGPEALRTNVHNSAADVWSFGVSLWEMLSCGSQPFDGIEPEEVANALERGIRLAQPYNCPDELYGVMYCCWQYDPLNRPSAPQILRALEEFNQQLNQFI